MKKKSLFSLLFLALLTIFVSACSKNSVQKNNLPSPQVILSKAQNTKFKSLHATWLQTATSGQTLQKAEARFQKKPLTIFAYFTTNSNHYKMWMNDKQNYVQMQGTASNHWSKTKMGKASSYAQLTDQLAQSALMTFSSNSAKLFKVRRSSNGYQLTYTGNNKKIFNEIIQNTMITSVIGIDTNNIKPVKMVISLNTNQKYDLNKLNIDVTYKEKKAPKHIKMIINQINGLPKMQIPSNVTKSAVDLGSLSH